MSFITAQDGTQIFYKDWGPKTGQPIVFSHGWPLSADAWDGQMLHFALKGFRVIAHDRRSHGRSDQTATGNDMDTYADDLAAVLSALDVNNAVLVGHSTGGGEVAHYIGRHGTGRVAKAVLVGAVPPRMSKSDAYPNGLPLDIFDGIRAGVAANRSQFYLDLTTPFYGFNRPGKSVNDGLRLDFWRQGMAGGIVGQYACIREFSEVDYTDDLKKINVPTLFIHGSDDQIVPIGHAAELAVTLVPNGTLIVYDGADHGLAQTHADRLNADLLAFIQK
ncbi:non-heme chloroperoxidase [Elstera cyanobacteriorum]|uniref:Alpha/beta hydrolase n=1 Tax=Elstera cyanobacteriorum TaxID=2022747 RepID=A0A255XMH9_9PROT|nr:alpha/beta hydrolase [Elstera cyanobacteriorum]OYQ17470.1 alpha/beta hydrolase [Elstera cyanobacteriorum]GFZ94229.1 non-heme chloroperoxidase [Elstera cyanobacteriorum]